MRKRICKKAASLALALAMAVSVCTTALAEGDTEQTTTETTSISEQTKGNGGEDGPSTKAVENGATLTLDEFNALTAIPANVTELTVNLDGVDFDLILGPESRGFIFGMPLAYNLKKGFVPVRKKGKLPAEVISKEYALEYGTAVIEVHKDAIQPGQKVVIVDDLLATGGTAKAIIEMVESVGAEVVGLTFLIELDFLHGRDVLEGYNISSVLHY